MLRGGSGEKEANELLPPLHAQQDPHRQETQLPAQRRGPGVAYGVRQAGGGKREYTCIHSITEVTEVIQCTYMMHLETALLTDKHREQ